MCYVCTISNYVQKRIREELRRKSFFLKGSNSSIRYKREYNVDIKRLLAGLDEESWRRISAVTHEDQDIVSLGLKIIR